MNEIRKYLLAGVALAAFTLAALMTPTPPPAHAQTPSLPPQPYNVELGAVITNGARAPSTVTTAKLQNLAYGGVVCTFLQTAASGSPTTTFAVQMYDSASNTYQTLGTAASTSTTGTPISFMVYPGIATTGSLPNSGVMVNVKLPLYWRVTQTVSGANTTTTGTIGCNLLK